MESKTRLLFVRGGLPEPELNAAVCDAAGEWLAFGDFVWRKQHVVAEFDGDFHRTDRRQWQRDVGRRESVQEAGWTYVQLTARSVTVPAYAIASSVDSGSSSSDSKHPTYRSRGQLRPLWDPPERPKLASRRRGRGVRG